MKIGRHWRSDSSNMLRVSLITFAVLFASQVAATPSLSLERVPDNGIQPRLFTDNKGQMHLIYFKRVSPTSRGPALGKLYYRYRISRERWSEAEVVSGLFRHGDAVRKASVVAGDAGSIHVVWFTSDKAPAYYYNRRIDDKFQTPRSIADLQFVVRSVVNVCSTISRWSTDESQPLLPRILAHIWVTM